MHTNSKSHEFVLKKTLFSRHSTKLQSNFDIKNMSQTIEIQDKIIRIDNESQNTLLVRKAQKQWTILLDKDKLHAKIYSIAANDVWIIIYTSKGFFMSKNLGESWEKV